MDFAPARSTTRVPLSGQDNELYANQILKLGDQMKRTTNVKADMTHWETFLPEWKHLGTDVMEKHLPEFMYVFYISSAIEILNECSINIL
mgnify:CR=1 FL=1